MSLAMVPQLRLLGMVLLVAVVSAGCFGGKPLPDFVEHLVPVRGKVTMNGKPLQGAMLTFHPAKNNLDGMLSYGNTDANGVYETTTIAGGHGPQRGTVKGEYVVTLSKIAMKDGSSVPEGMTDADAEAEGAKEMIPRQYSQPGRSPLKVQIADEGTSHDFDL